MLARRFLYPHVFEMRTAVRYSTQTNMHTQANCENANTRALEVEKEQRLRTTLIWYMHYKSKSKKSPKYCGHADWYDFPPSDATSSDPGKVKHKLNAACTWPVGPLAKCKTATKRYVHHIPSLISNVDSNDAFSMRGAQKRRHLKNALPIGTATKTWNERRLCLLTVLYLTGISVSPDIGWKKVDVTLIAGIQNMYR